MKNLSILGLSLLIGLSCGCSDELENQGTLIADGRNSLVATIGESIQSRTTIDTTGTGVLWAQGDAIGVYTSKGNLVQYTLKSGEGEKTAVFSNENNLPEGETPLWAVYPYSNVDATTEQTQYQRIKMTLPATVEFDGCSNGPMFAVVNNEQLSFNHMTGLLCIPVSGIPATAKTIKIQAPGIAGDFYGQYKSQTGAFTVPTLASISNSAVGEINITLPDEQQGIANLYIPMVAKEYAYLNLFVLDNDGNEIDEIRKTTSFNVEKGHIYTMAEFAVSEPISVPTKEEFYEAITSGNPNITVTAAIELDQNIELAKNSKITFNVAPTIAENVVFKAAENATITSFTLSYPYNVAESETTQTLNIELPDCDVNLLNIDESGPLSTNLENAVWDAVDAGQNVVVSKVEANVSAKSIVIGSNAFFDRLSVTGTNIQINNRGFLIKLNITTGSSATVKNYGNGVTGSVFGITDWKTDENGVSRSMVAVPSDNVSTWNGDSISEPTLRNGVYRITSAEKLAWFQTKVVPTAANAGGLPVTFDKGAILSTDIDLAGHPWAGAVIKNATFDGNGKTIYNLNIQQFVMNQQGTIYTPDACVGLFAAAYEGAVIKNLTLDGVTIANKDNEEKPIGSPKWVGSLVGYSYGAVEYTNCVAKNVNITISGANSYRVGGLIGYIEGYYKDNDPAKVKLTGCEVHDATIAASYSYGGLVGSMFDSATFTDCKTSGITLNLNDNPGWHGYVSNFIGDIANVATSYARTIKINDCSATDLTDADKARLRFDLVANEQSGTSLPTGAFQGNCPWCGLVEPANDVVNDAKKFKIVVNETALVHGTDYNVCTNAEQ